MSFLNSDISPSDDDDDEHHYKAYIFGVFIPSKKLTMFNKIYIWSMCISRVPVYDSLEQYLFNQTYKSC